MARAATQPRDRRGAIASALYRCISDKGFASTTLRDIAAQAGMTPSHVGYYFDNKGAILEYYATAICRRNVAERPDLDEPDFDRLVESISTFCLGEGQMSRGLLGVIHELNGLAVHDETLHAIKAEHATAWRQYLEDFFARAGSRSGLLARDAAHLAHAMLIGLNTNTLFDPELRRENARKLFSRTLRSLAGREEESESPIQLETRRHP